MYFDNDQYNAYIAIVQGLPIDGGTAPRNPWFYPGDIAIDADNNPLTGEYGFEYGLKVRSENGFQQGYLYSVSNWEDVYYSQDNIANPYKILSGTSPSQIDFVYSLNQNTHYVLEAKIPLGLLGLSANPGDPICPLRIHWTQQCGNDYLTLNADVNPVPEPTTLLLLGTGLIGLSTLARKRFGKK
ncbi:MAG TPA: PEP-CTERM sorting domain-containing protein [Proteobacteria bacterium]|nr:PEP-CTERM sorting domain-containing protein [Pseudomonadota bacterium]